MKRYYLFLSFWILWTYQAFSQSEPKFYIEVSTDSVLMENYFEVKFILENGQGKNFEPPSFAEFQVVGGPNQSSSIRMVNGAVDQNMTFSFFLKPKEVGNYFIQPASIVVNGKTLETNPLSVIVVPNPDGIIQNKEDNMEFRQELPFWHGSETDPVEPVQPPQKKRKVYKM